MSTSIARLVLPALAAILVGGTAAAAQGPGALGQGPVIMTQHRPPFEAAMGIEGRWWNNPRMMDRLKLTDDQRKAMDTIWFQHREKLIDLQANLEKAELAMEPLIGADQPDQAAMEAQINRIVAARADLEKANALFLLDIRMKLTPDQWKQLKDLRASMMMHHHEMGHGRDGGPDQRMWRQRRDDRGAPPPPDNPPADGNPPAGQAPAPQQ